VATGGHNGWIQTMIGGFAAVVASIGAMYTGVIAPLQTRIEKLETGREKDHDQLASLYTSIQTNDEYKKTVQQEMTWLRTDIQRVQQQANALDETHKQRAGQAAQIDDLKERWGILSRRLDEQTQRGAPSILDEVKTLRGELENLRQRIMVPLSAAPKG
jgi:chromosome segregation ATPase